MIVKLISHCHTYHSFDSTLRVKCIIEEALEYGINCIIVNDHDVFSLTTEEQMYFHDNGITTLRAVEFTSKEGVHVIGVHDEIKKLERKPFSYPLMELIVTLVDFGAKIIFPHPSHETGVYGNRKIAPDDFEFSIKHANAFEVDNYRYGITPTLLVKKILRLNPSIIQLIGSDAHKKSEVGAFVNVYDTLQTEDYQISFASIFLSQPRHLKVKKRSKLYFRFKKFQKGAFYQRLIGSLDYKQRQRIKKYFKFGK